MREYRVSWWGLVLRSHRWAWRYWYSQIIFNRIWRATGWGWAWKVNCWLADLDRISRP